MFLKSLVSVAALVAIAACSPSAKEGVVKRGESTSGPFGLIKHDAIKVDNESAFKGLDKVVVGTFNIGFATYKTDSAKAGGGLTGSGFGGKSTAKSTLEGVDSATMQKITDEAYKSFVADLKAKGITVVDRKEFLSYKGVNTATTHPNPYEDSTGGLFGANSKTMFFSPSSFGNIMAFLGDIPGLSSGFSGMDFNNPMVPAGAYARETGVKVLSVTYVLDFANAESYGNSFTTTSSVTVGQGLTVVPGLSRIAVVGGSGGTFDNRDGRVSLGQPITSEKEFAKVEDATSDTARGVEIATNVVGILGGIGSNVSRAYTFTANPAKYKVAAVDAFSQANDALTGKLASLK